MNIFTIIGALIAAVPTTIVIIMGFGTPGHTATEKVLIVPLALLVGYITFYLWPYIIGAGLTYILFVYLYNQFISKSK